MKEACCSCEGWEAAKRAELALNWEVCSAPPHRIDYDSQPWVVASFLDVHNPPHRIFDIHIPNCSWVRNCSINEYEIVVVTMSRIY